MNLRYFAPILAAALISSPALAQAPVKAAAKPSLLTRMKAVAHTKTTATKTMVTSPAKPAPSATNNGQGQRTAKSLACSKQADAKNVHGKDRKSFMSHCKKA